MKLFVTVCLIASCLAAPQQGYEAPAPYDFNYKVENPPTNTYFGQNEVGDITGRVTGSYYVYLPDGRLMTVEYVSDQNGYVPRISFTQNGHPVQG
ncbi:Pro-resilin-like Protein [Tribolium castaneum]|uniref:Pro-resilin-like Protein n=1 Tax=Tribolium castaneum TaxID=7070 RepID=A0A139WDG8_TRICA|nr:PREDICTED: pro-resilin-like [Tribolium castaneum]KYB25990.1 Pro-resilin-like Protein [Tribolium castaneum]|eukprot:XP_008196637.1 PREDICTED: pro-resilin-like [Tribolium castaneum]